MMTKPVRHVQPGDRVVYWAGVREGGGHYGRALSTVWPKESNDFGTDVVCIEKAGGTDCIATTHLLVVEPEAVVSVSGDELRQQMIDAFDQFGVAEDSRGLADAVLPLVQARDAVIIREAEQRGAEKAAQAIEASEEGQVHFSDYYPDGLHIRYGRADYARIAREAVPEEPSE
jgi:hypothetical protein